MQKTIFAPQTALSLFSNEERKVRTPKSSIAGNARLPILREGQVQQKECTGNAVVKPGKLYAVKCQVYQQFLSNQNKGDSSDVEG